jgi:hypothetical protein
MNYAPIRDQIDPQRFTGKTFARRKAFPNSVDDYVIQIDGLTAGRVMKMTLTGQMPVWFWTLTGPYFPGPQSQDGQEATFEAALEEFEKVFWQWHVWALRQPGKTTWHGAGE